MTRFLHLTPLGSKNGIFDPPNPKNEKLDPPPDFCIKISRHLQKQRGSPDGDPLFFLLAVDGDGGGGEGGGAVAVAIDIGAKALIRHVHLTQPR